LDWSIGQSITRLPDYPITRFSCDAARTDELGPRDCEAPGVAANRHGGRCLIQRPAWCFMAARDAAKRHPLLLEVQHRVVPVQTAEGLTQHIDHAAAKPFLLRRAGSRPHPFVRCDRSRIGRRLWIVRRLGDHCSPAPPARRRRQFLGRLRPASGSGDFKSRAVSASPELSAEPLWSCENWDSAGTPAGVFSLVSDDLVADAKSCRAAHPWKRITLVRRGFPG
jgi:hypothetical protein